MKINHMGFSEEKQTFGWTFKIRSTHT